MKTSENLGELLPALAKVKAQMGAVAKSSSNPFFKSKYADLNSHLEVVEPLLEANGLLLVQPVQSSDSGNLVKSTIFHVVSGQWISSEMGLVGETDMQKVGSAVTYARRYTLGSLLSMKAEDDDGNSAVGKKQTKSAKTVSTPKTTGQRKSFADRVAKPAPSVETYNTGDDL